MLIEASLWNRIPSKACFQNSPIQPRLIWGSLTWLWVDSNWTDSVWYSGFSIVLGLTCLLQNMVSLSAEAWCDDTTESGLLNQFPVMECILCLWNRKRLKLSSVCGENPGPVYGISSFASFLHFIQNLWHPALRKSRWKPLPLQVLLLLHCHLLHGGLWWCHTQDLAIAAACGYHDLCGPGCIAIAGKVWFLSFYQISHEQDVLADSKQFRSWTTQLTLWWTRAELQRALQRLVKESSFDSTAQVPWG